MAEIPDRQRGIVKEEKGLLQSKTFWGVTVMVLAMFSEKLFGVKVDDVLNGNVDQSMVTLAGAALAIWGRVKAKAAIKSIT